ncbi:hypothetical protein Ccrd_002085, partial [Cynara cardunculus var. scolymus]
MSPLRVVHRRILPTSIASQSPSSFPIGFAVRLRLTWMKRPMRHMCDEFCNFQGFFWAQIRR